VNTGNRLLIIISERAYRINIIIPVIRDFFISFVFFDRRYISPRAVIVIRLLITDRESIFIAARKIVTPRIKPIKFLFRAGFL